MRITLFRFTSHRYDPKDARDSSQALSRPEIGDRCERHALLDDDRKGRYRWTKHHRGVVTQKLLYKRVRSISFYIATSMLTHL